MMNYKPLPESKKNKLICVIKSSEVLQELAREVIDGNRSTEILYRIILESYELGEKSRK